MKWYKSLSIMVVAFVLLVSSSVAAFAANDKSIEISSNNDITISNYDEEIAFLRDGWDENPIYTSYSEVTITFNGNALKADVAPFSYESKEFQLDAKKGFTYVPVKGEIESLTFGENSWIIDADPGDQISFTKEGFYKISFYSDDEYKGIFVHIKKAPKITAVPISSKVLVDGKTVALEAYSIGGYNYFKLRDLAAVVNGTEKQFNIGWDNSKNAIKLISGEAYKTTANDLKVSANPTKKNAIQTNSKIYLDGKEVRLTAYNISNNNYFKLRDVADLFDIGVSWNSKANAVEISTKSSK